MKRWALCSRACALSVGCYLQALTRLKSKNLRDDCYCVTEDPLYDEIHFSYIFHCMKLHLGGLANLPI